MAGTHRMLAPEENLSVMRVQEGLNRLGFDAGELDGIFGPTTGEAVHAFKAAHGLAPDDPVVGRGTSAKLDELLLHVSPLLDPDFGEVAGFVARHSVEPFLGLELGPLIMAPLNSQRHDVARALLDALNTGACLAMVAGSRAAGVVDPRLPDDIRRQLSNLGPASGMVVHFTSADGVERVVMALDDVTIRGRRSLVHRPTGRKVKIDLRSVICHELTHVRNAEQDLDSTPDSDPDVFLDPNLAASMSAASGTPSAVVFRQFVNEMNARHVAWIIEQELVGNPFAARFLPGAALADAAHFYFAESDREFYFDDNGYIGTILARGHQATYQQMALWLRRCATLTFHADPGAQATSSQLFLDAADSADLTALNPGLVHPPGDGLFPRDQDFV